ncbi:MAG: nicotinamide-nucleotide amidohydrolase family protein [Deltaproteobacteria bacterium]|nr:nicotinamide-nucleotide amidohydrolase family protein [Deltaproteobacteria bacterium]
MKIAIVTTGDEIMSGNVVDTNSAWIADKCWMLGHEVVWHGGVGDYKEGIGDACVLASERAEIVFVSGGLGATLDDITLESAAAAFGKKMIGGKPLENKVGTAPGVQVKLGKAVFFFLPGVPRELYQIFEDSILPLLKEMAGGGIYRQKFLRCFGLPEASLDERLKGLDFGGVRVSFRVTYPEVKIKLVARKEKTVTGDKWLVISEAEKKIRERIGDYVFGVDDETMEAAAGNLLKKKKMTIAVAESCTGGYISNLITNVAGSSEWFERGVISYSNKSKMEILGVKAETIKKYGAVSEECTREMAEGVLKISGAGIGLSVTGVAGPSGGTEGKPVGTVHIALATHDETRHISCCHPRPREQFKMLTAYEALDMVRRL